MDDTAEENQTCFCGKVGTETCSKCKSTKYCSRECQKSDWSKHKLSCLAVAEPKSEAVIDLFGDIKAHITKSWRLIIMSLFKTQINNKDEYGSYLVVTVPQGYLPFEKSDPKPAYWTFCLITNCGKFFLLWSDHREGVATRILSKPLSLRSEDAVGNLITDAKMPAEGVRCDLTKLNRIYAKLNWETGEFEGIFRIYQGKLIPTKK